MAMVGRSGDEQRNEARRPKSNRVSPEPRSVPFLDESGAEKNIDIRRQKEAVSHGDQEKKRCEKRKQKEKRSPTEGGWGKGKR